MSEPEKRRAVLDAAIRYVGVEESGGNNRGRVYELFMKPFGYPPGTQYCGLSLHRIHQDAGVNHHTKHPALAANWIIPTRRIVYRNGRVVPGKAVLSSDITVFRYGGKRVDHVALVVNWPSDETYFYMWTANSSSPVTRGKEGVYLKKIKKSSLYAVVNPYL